MPEMPEWAHVWFWLRFIREPQVMTPLPQQDEPGGMDESHYELYHDEWLTIGAPRTSTHKIVAAMTGGRP